ncbi:VOC family protein [Luteimicrobium subarcticum]|uniref:Glyoxalase-like domain-containing protein n=1 Tax=Luteimicrobium subarcticum TaxID=620910 RepID=A0A2M8W3C8_9MICO|nr:VOC family protein [Luteimicrobium subarcticum]PJI85446.1 hypothetical protein CLV34_2958 [Luteimicrobium subarcticum]
MAIQVQVTFDAHDPAALGEFWCAALGYVRQPPPDGFASWDDALDAWGVPPDQRDSANALVDPDGVGPRLFLQQVPEPKTAKNRVHLDLNVGRSAPEGVAPQDAVRAHVARLVALGATVVAEREVRGESWVVLQDPEGNELCVQ